MANKESYTLHFDLSLEDARAFYDFIEGPDVATRRPAPSLGVIMVAERKAWREIALKIHSGLALSQAVKKQMDSFLPCSTLRGTGQRLRRT